MKQLILLTIFLLACSIAVVRAQGIGGDEIFLDALAFRGDTADSSRVDVLIAVPYSILDFERKAGIHTARYRLRLSVVGGGTTMYDSVFTRTVTTPSYETSNGTQPAFEFYQQRIALPAGRYRARAEFLDIKANRVASADDSVVVQPTTGQPFSTSDLMLVARIREDSAGFVISPMLSQNVSSIEGGYFVFFEAYNATTDTLFAIRSTFRQTQKEGRVDGPTAVRRIPSGKSQQWIHLPDTGLSNGTYVLQTDFFSLSDTARLLASKERYIVTSGSLEGAPGSAEDLEERLSELRYVASQTEIERIRGAGTFTEKRRQYADFWRKLDPTPSTMENEAMDEYFRRIEYANRSFRSYAAGWLTDKGRVYIIYGPPDNTSTDPFRNEGKAVETWQYYRRNLRAVFVDESGFGDFRLMTYLPPGEKYRYGE